MKINELRIGSVVSLDNDTKMTVADFSRSRNTVICIWISKKCKLEKAEIPPEALKDEGCVPDVKNADIGVPVCLKSQPGIKMTVAGIDASDGFNLICKWHTDNGKLKTASFHRYTLCNYNEDEK
jgi:uncharacterized protein YodC (DUF2158 family)